MERRTLIAAGTGAGIIGMSGCADSVINYFYSYSHEFDSPPDHIEAPASAPDNPSGWQRGESDTEVYRRVDIDELYRSDTPPEPSVPELRCAMAAGEVVFDYLETQLDSMTGITHGHGKTSGYDGYSVRISLESERDRNGDIVSEPDAEFDRVVSETPKTGFATIDFETGEHDCAVPIYVREQTKYQD